MENKPLWQLTVGEFVDIIREHVPQTEPKKEKKYVYGIEGIAEIFNCSRATAQRIKNSGRIDKAISQVGRKIMVDVDRVIELNKLKK